MQFGHVGLQGCVLLAAVPAVAAADGDAGAIAAVIGGMLFIVAVVVFCGYQRAPKRRDLAETSSEDDAAAGFAGDGAIGRSRPGSGSGIGDYNWAARDKVARDNSLGSLDQVDANICWHQKPR